MVFDYKGSRCRNKDTFACCFQKKVYGQSQTETLQHTEVIGRHSFLRLKIRLCACLSTGTYPQVVMKVLLGSLNPGISGLMRLLPI